MEALASDVLFDGPDSLLYDVTSWVLPVSAAR